MLVRPNSGKCWPFGKETVYEAVAPIPVLFALLASAPTRAYHRYILQECWLARFQARRHEAT